MMYNKNEFPRIMQTAGKITVLTALGGVLVFVMAFLFNAGTEQIQRVAAQTATTTLTVLNTPPSFTLNAYEVTESSTSSPTNSGTAVQWRAIGSDSNGAPYFLLICSTNASPTANSAIDNNNLGTEPPDCGGGTQWGVSAATVSGNAATVATTTIEAFAEQNNWYAWVCDDDPFNPRCNNVPVQGYSATNSSPFNVNHRPVLTSFNNNGPVDPGGTLLFSSVSTDPDVVDAEDRIYLIVCQTAAGIDPVARTCNANGLASSTSIALANATSSYALAAIVRDTTYGAYGYLVDQHGHTATANPINQNFTVNNVAPAVPGGTISLNGGSNITLTVPGDETTGFSLQAVITDANSCTTTAGISEINSIDVAVFRAGPGGGHSTSTCNWNSGTYDANDCYTSGVSQSMWNLVCTPDVASCTSPTDNSMVYNCTFPLWFIADPTDAGINTPTDFANSVWTAGVRAEDDDGLFSAMSTSSSPVELISFTALDLLTAAIPYGALEPGDDTGTLSATTTIQSMGNTGLDQEVRGESMCIDFAVGNECEVSATSTVPENQQKFASTSRTYGSVLATALSSSTNQEVELDVNKPTSTSTPEYGDTYWGIAVPISITLAGSYEGLNTFIAKTAEAANW